MKIKTCDHFALHELLPPDIYYHLKDQNVLWKGWLLVPPTTIETVDALRKELGPMFINTYALSEGVKNKYGTRTQSGKRRIDFDDKPNYVSAHYHLLGTDSKFRDCSAEEARKYILKNEGKFPFINRLECTIKGKEINWLHWDSVSVEGRIVQLHL